MMSETGSSEGIMAASGKQMRAVRLDSREYKLLLRPEGFAGETMAERVNRLWHENVVPVVETLDRTASGRPRHAGCFELADQRPIRYRDTAAHDLDRLDLSLRLRGNSPAELTLKYRMPDLFVVAEAAARHASGKPGLEEDIAPLEVQHRPKQVVGPMSPSMRSRFAWSEDRAPPDPLPGTVAELAGLFPLVKARLRQDPANGAKSSPLLEGPQFDEYVFRGPFVDFGGKAKGKFAFTLWFPRGETGQARVAELSWRCKFGKSPMPGRSALRAYQLFLGLQRQLQSSIDEKNSSKTKLALP